MRTGTTLMIVGSCMMIYGFAMVKLKEEQKVRIHNLLNESKRLNKEKDSLLHKRDSLMKELEITVNDLNSLK